jgi:hypothetical protein
MARLNYYYDLLVRPPIGGSSFCISIQHYGSVLLFLLYFIRAVVEKKHQQRRRHKTLVEKNRLNDFNLIPLLVCRKKE